MSDKIAIIITNYLNYQVTYDCVNCALAQKHVTCNIIIIENGSQNESYDFLKKNFGNYENIKIIRLRKNIGYAKGSNVGIRYAKEVLKADYVFVCNSDIIFDSDFIYNMMQCDYKGIGAISPTVYQADGSLQPFIVRTNFVYLLILKTIFETIKEWLMKFKFFEKLISNVKNKEFITAKSIIKFKKNKPIKYTIQGCCYLLTPEFFRFYKKLYPNTFLYGGRD